MFALRQSRRRVAHPGLCVLLIAAFALLFSNAARADMLTVSPDGVLLKDGKPYRAIGANLSDAFLRHWEHPGDLTYDRDFATLEAEGIPFARVFATYWEPDAMMEYVNHREDYLAKLDGVVASAEKHHVGLILSLFWWDAAVPDLVHEPRSAWGDRDSKTIAFMREYTRTIVSRYKDSPTVWAWEFGNEFSMQADLPNAADWRPRINPYFGWPEKRTKADDLTTRMILVAFTEFGKTVREIDPIRAITTGNGCPGAMADLQRRTLQWGKPDTRAQFRANLALVNPDPINTLAIHLYRYSLVDRFGRSYATYGDLLTEAMKVAATEKKPLFVLEFGSALGHDGLNTPDAVRKDFEVKLRAIVDNRVPLSAFWDVTSSISYGSDEYTVSREKGLGYMFDGIKAANAEIAAQLESEERIADVLPLFEAATEAADRDAIRALQRLLTDRGFKPGAVDGSYGRATRQALTACIAAGACSAADAPDAKPPP
jgi:hypothetical protein